MATKAQIITGAVLIVGGAAIAAITLIGSEKAAQQQAEADLMRDMMLAGQETQAQDDTPFEPRPDSICWEFTGSDLGKYCGNPAPSAEVAACLDHYVMEIKTRGDYYHPARDTAITEAERQSLACEMDEAYADHPGYHARGVNSMIPDHVSLGRLSD